MNDGKPKKYWRSPEEMALKPHASAPGRSDKDEWMEALATDAENGGWKLDRRSFLKAAGFSAAALAVTACQRSPLQKAVPYLIQPEEITPGKAYWYASTCMACPAACGALVKNRDGRPIKLEGNPEHPLSRGGLCAAGQASVLELYDSTRLKNPLRGGSPASWEEVDGEIMRELAALKERGGKLRLLTGSTVSPSLRAAIGRFMQGFTDARHVEYDPLPASAILDAHAETHGARVLPRYRLEDAEVIVGIDADFLGAWISPVEYTAGYRAGRRLDAEPPRMSRHIHFESRLSLTGGNADRRIALAPHELAPFAAHLALAVAELAGQPLAWNVPAPCPVDAGLLHETARELWAARGQSLVVCGLQDMGAQIAVNHMNHMLGNYGRTLDLERPSHQRRGDDGALAALLKECQRGEVGALLVAGVNPLAELPNAGEMETAFRKISLTVSFSSRVDETSFLAKYVCPEPHFLEGWSDAEPTAGIFSLVQPALSPHPGRRAMLESLHRWLGGAETALELIREHWRNSVFPRQSAVLSFETFWNRALQQGFVETAPEASAKTPSWKDAVPVFDAAATEAGGLALVLYAKPAILDGRHAHNPWLQELPDPVSKVVWDNYAALAPEAAARLGIRQGDVLRISAKAEGRDVSVEVPAFLQPGQHGGTVALALGYGRMGTERFATVGPQWISGKPTVEPGERVGKNVSEFLSLARGLLGCRAEGVRIVRTGRWHELACTQDYHRLEVPERLAAYTGERRPMLREADYEDFRRDPASGNEPEHAAEDIWKNDHRHEGPRWAMVIDLAACTGCSGCVVACQAENNIPAVGRDEVRRHREMHWLRIDRYYAGEGGDTELFHQPMLCQQCDHAPCETVCPVLATVHSAEGLNQQVYNRCVGTRYCANNCPYKARRFNWFDYLKEPREENLVLNPDVTVRSRGVMEKCTFCVQRIQEAKLEARRKGEPLRDGALQTACQQSCPADAIVFGDLSDPESEVSRRMRDPRRYRVLAELGVQPSVGYLTRVRNSGGKSGGGSHA